MSDNIARALKDSEVRNAKPKPTAYKMTDGGGMFLLVQPAGAKLWRYKFRLHGKEGLFSIGGYPDVTLAEARTIHRAARAQVAAGENPVSTRKETRRQAVRKQALEQAGEFMKVANDWRANTDDALAAASIKQRRLEMAKHIEPRFKGQNIANVTRQEIAELLKRVEAKTPETARNLRNYMFSIMEHAIGLGLLDANPVPPPRILKRRQSKSHAAFDLDQLKAFLVALDMDGAGPDVHAAMLLVIMTACRKNEVCEARWSEFDLDAAEWTIPAERMKARKEHWVPLPHQAVKLLRKMRRLTNGDLVFPNRDDPDRSMANRTLNAVMDRVRVVPGTVHGLRSTFSTHWNGEKRNADVIELCLAHSPANAVRAVYNRHQYKDERRELLQEWADLLLPVTN